MLGRFFGRLTGGNWRPPAQELAFAASAGFDTVQIAPSVGTESDPLAVTARLIIGKRLSDRAYVTFSRALGSSSSARDQIIILEYDVSDRAGWVLTQNGDRTFAIEFRVRRSF